MSKHHDTLINHAERLALDTVDVPAESVHWLAKRVMELEATVAKLLNVVTRYRVHHDMIKPPSHRPCECDMCREADRAIAAAKGREGDDHAGA